MCDEKCFSQTNIDIKKIYEFLNFLKLLTNFKIHTPTKLSTYSYNEFLCEIICIHRNTESGLLFSKVIKIDVIKINYNKL